MRLKMPAAARLSALRLRPCPRLPHLLAPRRRSPSTSIRCICEDICIPGVTPICKKRENCDSRPVRCAGGTQQRLPGGLRRLLPDSRVPQAGEVPGDEGSAGQKMHGGMGLSAVRLPRQLCRGSGSVGTAPSAPAAAPPRRANRPPVRCRMRPPVRRCQPGCVREIVIASAGGMPTNPWQTACHGSLPSAILAMSNESLTCRRGDLHRLAIRQFAQVGQDDILVAGDLPPRIVDLHLVDLDPRSVANARLDRGLDGLCAA